MLNDFIDGFCKLEIDRLQKEKRNKLGNVQRCKKPRFGNGVTIATDGFTLEARIIQSNSRLIGDIVLEDIRRAIGLRTELNKHQRIFIEIFVQSNFPNIYKKEFRSNELRIKLENHIDEIRSFAFVCCPRRWGKTFATAWFVACAMACMIDVNILIFSPALRQCDLFKTQVERGLMLLRDSGYNFTYGMNNKSILAIRRPGRNTENRMQVLPAKENTTRGVGANIIICEEAAALDKGFFAAIIIPLLTVVDTTLLAISTVQNEDNYFTQLISSQAASDERTPISVYKFFPACTSCKELGQAKSCKHLLSDRPDWMSSARTENIQQMYAITDNEALMEQEIMGMSKSNKRPAFPQDAITRLFMEDRIFKSDYFHRPPLMVYSCIDPTGGGGSDLAIVSCIYENGLCVFVGMESIAAKSTDEYMPQLVQHYQKIRTIKRFNEIHYYIWVENNMLLNSNDIMKTLKVENNRGNLRNVHIMDNMGIELKSIVLGNTISDNQKGALTTHDVKQKMWKLFREHLVTNRLGFHEEFVTVHHPNPGNQKYGAVNCIREMFNQQLTSYSIMVQEATNPGFQKDKLTYSGKHSSGSKKDDLATAAQLVIYWAWIRMNNDNIPSYT